MADRTEQYWFDGNDDCRTQRRKKQRFQRNQARGLSLAAMMFELRKSYQLLFITLNVDKRYRDDVNFWTMQRMRRALFQRIRDAHAHERRRRNMGRPLEDDERTIFHDIIGLVWRQETGYDGGSEHVHLVVFVSVSRRDHVRACEELGMAWNRITKWGSFDNANRYARTYSKKWGIAIGYVHRNDEEKRGALHKLIGLYMSKVVQEPLDRDEDDKLFGVRYFG